MSNYDVESTVLWLGYTYHEMMTGIYELKCAKKSLTLENVIAYSYWIRTREDLVRAGCDPAYCFCPDVPVAVSSIVSLGFLRISSCVCPCESKES